MITTEAILIRRIPLTETSLIVSWCSADRGLIKTVAKGARRSDSRLAGRLDLFLTAEIAMVLSRRSDLHTLADAGVTNHRLGVRSSYHRVLAASYFIQLIEQIAERETPIPEQFALLTRALDFLDRSEPDTAAVIHFERELARGLGIHVGGAASAIDAIRRFCHAVPAQRQKLLDELKR